MIKLPKISSNNETKDVCICRPICKNRRRQWKNVVQKTSAELLFERKPLPECFRRWPMKVNTNSTCPLYGKKRQISNKPQNGGPSNIVTVCRTPLDDSVDTPYLKFAEMAMKLGAWDAVQSRCAFCKCGTCCACGSRDYELSETRDMRNDMRRFDARVKHCPPMRIMYDVV